MICAKPVGSVLRMNRNIEAWDGEGGAAAGSPQRSSAVWMSGTTAQVEWAERIKRQVDAEFDRVAASFRSIAARQHGERRAETEAVLAILEDKRAKTMRREQAGYFIHDWQEIGNQVQKMILNDPRYDVIRSSRAARKLAGR